ncbi:MULTISPECIES: hypothetical protein [unclassified Streptomyces]|uniref:hypothetical protein n=1 Tax=unclassified Streptomyces TaxID=2593676 RepID=UPI0003AA2508|nr:MULTISPECIES: hypothetical protein [unclassified Streptomyces]MYX32896.1 hypothetical protein [Streptomyces sp. SID8377]
MPYADERINGCTAQSLTRAIHTALPGAELTSLQPTDQRLGSLRLRERADLLTNALLTDVPGDYAEVARVVRAAKDGTPVFGGWLIWPSRAPSPPRRSPSTATMPSMTRWRSWPTSPGG